MWPLAKKVAWEKEVKALPDLDKAPATVIEAEDVPAPKKRVTRKKSAIEAEPAPAKKKPAAKKAKPASRAKPQDAGDL